MSNAQTSMTKKKKRKVQVCSNNEEPDSKAPRIDEEQNEPVGAQISSPRTNLDLILSLKDSKIDLQRKLEIAFDFVKSRENINEDSDIEVGKQTVSKSRLVVVLSDWVQNVLTSFKGLREKLSKEPSLDFRCWEVLKFCLVESTRLGAPLSLRSGLLQAFGRFSEGVILVLDRGKLVAVVCECAESIFGSSGKLVYPNVEMWVATISGILRLVKKVGTDEFSEEGVKTCLLKISGMVMESFSNFLKVHPNPKNVFPVFVDKLLEVCLSLLMELDGKFIGSEFLRKVLEDILSNGLFHPVHIDGFLNISGAQKLKKLEDVKEKTLKTVNIRSYHRYFFQKIESFLVEKKMTFLEGLGELFHLFVIRARKQQGVSKLSMDSKMVTTSVDSSRMDLDINKSLFNLFVQFIQPLIVTLKDYSEADLEAQESRLLEMYSISKSANKILAVLMHEKIYMRTDDTLERNHLNVLKDIYQTVTLFSTKMHVVLTHSNMEDKNRTKTLILVTKEIIDSLGYFLETESEVFEDNIVSLWNVLLVHLAFCLSVTDMPEKHLLASEIMHLGGQVVNLYSELRQVSNAIFALCKAVRLFSFYGKNREADSFGYLPFKSSAFCLKAVTMLLCSQELRLSLAKSVRTIPEGQVSRCIHELKTDILESLEWMKVSYSMNPGEESKGPHLGFLAEIIGNILSEIYVLLLDNATVTNGNSVIVGNSVKEVMASIRPSLSILVKEHPERIQDFLSFVTEHPTARNSAWIFLFFFRLYTSCRSLYRQTMTLLPPNSSRKSSLAFGDLFTAYSGKDWIEMVDRKDEGYFHWVTASSDSLKSIIQSVSEIHLHDSMLKCAPLLYVLHIMAFQRLFDLNRQIKASEFLYERAVRLDELKLVDDSELHYSHKRNKKLNKFITALRQEATDLTSFVTGYLSLIMEKSNDISRFSSNDALSETEQDGDAWDLVVCSVSENLLPTAVWWMLCQNIDVWCIHATKKTLNKFLSSVINSSMLHLTYSGDFKKLNTPGNLRKVTLGQISLELLNNISFYEEKFVSKQLTSRFCKALEKSAASLFGKSMPGAANIDVLPDWSRVTTLMDEMLVVSNKRNLSYCDLSDMRPELTDTESCTEVMVCQSLLKLLCSLPKCYANSRSFPACAVHILNLERLILLSLLEYGGKVYMPRHLELVRLFAYCRRALKWLVMAYSQNSEEEKFSPIPVLSESSFSILWLLKSVSTVVQLQNHFPEWCASQVKDMVFSLMDHTSYIFMTISKNYSSLTVDSLICGDPRTEVGNSDGRKTKDMSNEIGPCEAWNVVVLVAETLREYTESLLSCLKTDLSNLNIIDVNKISSTVSCFQGFLWGLASTFNNKDETRTIEIKLLRKKYVKDYKLSICLKVFEDFVSFCIHALVVEDIGDHEVTKANPGTVAIKSSGARKKEMKSRIANHAANILVEVDLFERQYLKKSLLHSLFRGENVEVAFSLKQLFTASSAIMKLKFSLIYNKFLCSSIAISQFLLSEVADMVHEPDQFSFVWLNGLLKYVEVLGGYISLTNPISSDNLYMRLVDLHLKVIGKCISLQGKEATLASHETESNTKTFKVGLWPSKLTVGHGHNQYSLEEFKVKVRKSFKVLIEEPLESHLTASLKALERALVGVVEGCSVRYEIKTGGLDGGSISSVVAAGVDCLDQVLESISGRNLLKLVKEFIQSYIGALLNIILHLQGPLIFYQESTSGKNDTNPDPGSIILMCVEILGKVAGRSSLFKMYPYHVGQSLHISGELFQYLLKLRSPQGSSNSSVLSVVGSDSVAINRQFSVDLFAACCKLLVTVLRHHKSEAARCLPLLQDSVNTLLQCLETVNVDLFRSKPHFAWDLDEGVSCASFLRRVYEEIRQQKDIIGSSCSHILANYIIIYSGCGPLGTGIRREINEALKPGVYALIDVCSTDDLQQLHTVLGEGPCRSTLATLQRDYKLNFQFEGKV